MRKQPLPYLHSTKLVVRQGQQLWHLHQALQENSEADVVTEMARTYKDEGRVATLSEGLILAGAVITAYRSTEDGERVPQQARARLTEERRKARKTANMRVAQG